MADWFKLHENWFHEPRLQWAIKEQANVIPVWLWVLTECCRTKSNTIGLHSEDYEMLGIQQLLNISPGLFNQAVKLLEKIKYIEIDEDKKTIKALKWNDFQSDYLRKKGWRESDNVQKSPKKSDSVVLEERRGDKKRTEKTGVGFEIKNEGFSEFWELYPKKKGRGDAEKSWSKLKPDLELKAKIMKSLNSHLTSNDWVKDGGQFIPHPATWLNGKRWEDEVKSRIILRPSAIESGVFNEPLLNQPS